MNQFYAPQDRSDALLLEEALNLSSDGILVYQAIRDDAGLIQDYTLIAMNDPALRIFAMERGVVIGKRITALWPGIAQDDIWPHCAAVVEGRQPYSTEVQRTTPAGEPLCFEVTLRPYKDGFANSFRDITAYKNALQQSEQQRDFYEELVRQGISRYAVLSPVFDAGGEVIDFRYDYLNYGPGKEDSHRNLPQYPDPPVPGRLLTEFQPSIKSSRVWAFYGDIIRTGISARTQLHYSVDNVEAMVDLACKRLDDGRLLVAYSDISGMRRIADELAAEKQRLNGVLEHVPMGITVFEPVRSATGELQDLRLVHRNEKAVLLSRIPAERYKPGALLSELMPPELAGQEELLYHVMRSGEPLAHELYQPHLDIWISSRVIRFGDGLLSTIQDITEQKRNTQRVEKSARLLNAVLDASPMAVVVYDPVYGDKDEITDFRPIMVNQKALEFLGITMEAFMATSIVRRMPELGDVELDALKAVVRERREAHFEFWSEATGRWIYATATPFGDGFISTSQDITSSKEQNRIIEEQAELFNGVMNSLQNGLSILRIVRDKSGGLKDLEYIDVAESVVRDTGISREKTKGTSMRARFPGIEQTEYWKAYDAVARTGEPQQLEVHFTLKGFDNYLLGWVTPLGKDKLVSVYYIINDLKRTQRELEHKITELRQSNDDLEQFASIASHDLQEPLRKVQSFGNMLEARYADKLGTEGKDLVLRMQSAAGRMRDLVTGLLDFASLSRAHQDRMLPVDTGQLIREIIADVNPADDAPGAGIRIEGGLPPVLGIRAQLRHLFHNLLTNAIKFRKPGVASVIVVRALPLLPADRARLSPSANADQYVRIDVSDNGIGFDPIYADKIFGLFERLHGLSEYRGTGIGLSICRRVAERHDGVIYACGRPGEGATFTVLLPMAEAL